MAKISRTKEIWHIPKRGNVHQTVYLVHLLAKDKFSGKSWSRSKQELLATEMGKAGLTESGKALTHQSVRTLLANMPKYLGFVYIDESSNPSQIIVTKAGYNLLEENKIEDIPKHKSLKEYQNSNDLISTSEAFGKQMSKLILTNPIILKDCEEILLFPFRITLKLLLILEYLDKEEIGYILFHSKNEDEFELLIEKINNFRSMPPEKRTSEINAYEMTEEGQLTLVKAPSSGYYMYLCESTGICERFSVHVNKIESNKLSAIKLKNKDHAIDILRKFEGIEVYDFKDNVALWIEYFSDTNNMYPPFDVSINIDVEKDFLILVYNENNIVGSDVLSKDKNFSMPVFSDKTYTIDVFDLETGGKIYSEVQTFNRSDIEMSIVLGNSVDVIESTKEDILISIREMFSETYSGFDKNYYHKLNTILNTLSRNYIDMRRKGGRLEFLFFKLLDLLKIEGIVDEVYWYGKNSRYGINEPAPGGKEGNPDIVFEIDDYSFVLELTTYRGTRAQWSSSEASSVPDHIFKYKKTHSNRKVIGIFSAPTIHHQVEKNLLLNAQSDKVCMIFKPCIDFATFLVSTSREKLLKTLIDDCINQTLTK